MFEFANVSEQGPRNENEDSVGVWRLSETKLAIAVGHDVELWQLNRLVARFESPPGYSRRWPLYLPFGRAASSARLACQASYSGVPLRGGSPSGSPPIQ